MRTEIRIESHLDEIVEPIAWCKKYAGEWGVSWMYYSMHPLEDPSCQACPASFNFVFEDELDAILFKMIWT